MDRYKVYLSPQAYREIDAIYEYIKNELYADTAAERLVERLEKAILSLEEFPYRAAERNVGSFANQGYRQLFVENYVIIYRIDETSGIVVVITVQYIRRNI